MQAYNRSRIRATILYKRAHRAVQFFGEFLCRSAGPIAGLNDFSIALPELFQAGLEGCRSHVATLGIVDEFDR